MSKRLGSPPLVDRILRFMVVAVFALAFSSCVRSQTVKEEEMNLPPVPDRYRALYNELSAKLRDLRAMIDSPWNVEKSDTPFGVELLVANSNRGDILLTDRVWGATRLTLDRLEDIGIRSISLSIQYPTLTRSHPRSAEYLAFYKRVAQEIRRRGYVLVVEMGTTFREPEFSKMKVDYRGLTMDRFNDELREMVETIIENLRPDFLTILSEPDTQAKNTGLSFSVPNFAATIRHVVQGLQHQSVRLGAGAGTWNPMAYFNAMAEIPQLDYIDLHIYPIHRDFVIDKTTEIADIARKHREGISIGEAWLYKVSRRELGRVSPVKAFARDVNFWQPLDQLFLEVIVSLSRHVDAEFCSFFWMKYLYGYVKYDSDTKDLRPQQLINTADSLAGQKILAGTLGVTGKRLKMLIAHDQ